MSRGSHPKPNWRLVALDKTGRGTHQVGCGWTRTDGSIALKIDRFVVLKGEDTEMVLSLFKNEENEA